MRTRLLDRKSEVLVVEDRVTTAIFMFVWGAIAIGLGLVFAQPLIQSILFDGEVVKGGLIWTGVAVGSVAVAGGLLVIGLIPSKFREGAEHGGRVVLHAKSDGLTLAPRFDPVHYNWDAVQKIGVTRRLKTIDEEGTSYLFANVVVWLADDVPIKKNVLGGHEFLQSAPGGGVLNHVSVSSGRIRPLGQALRRFVADTEVYDTITLNYTRKTTTLEPPAGTL